MKDHLLAGFGFGPIQAGLFALEAFKSNRFRRMVVAEVDPVLVRAIRASGGRYVVNIASANTITSVPVDGMELCNPADETGRRQLLEALSQATEIVTSLPSVNYYSTGQPSVASLIGSGLANSTAPATLIYTAENNNHAAELLQQEIRRLKHQPRRPFQFLNTVIGKMSQVVTGKEQIQALQLQPITPDLDRAFLVESFNHILVTKCHLPGFTPGLGVFIEKEDLLPFEEAKLYGHNAIHVLCGFLGALKGYRQMAELEQDRQIMTIARAAFIQESGAALIHKYASLKEELFTAAGYQFYAGDLLTRITNPFLGDTIERACRDPLRKLGLHDRIFGLMQLALQQGIEPVNTALGAAAGLIHIIRQAREYQLPAEFHYHNWQNLQPQQIESLLQWLWSGQKTAVGPQLLHHVIQAGKTIADLLK